MTVAITRMEHTAADLRRHAAGSVDAAVARRLLALAMVLDGRKRADAARLAGMVHIPTDPSRAFRVHSRFWCSWMERGVARGHMGRISIEV